MIKEKCHGPANEKAEKAVKAEYCLFGRVPMASNSLGPMAFQQLAA